jgi:hypothetical protein
LVHSLAGGAGFAHNYKEGRIIDPKAPAYNEQSDNIKRVEQGRVLRRPAPRQIGDILRDLGWLPKGEHEPYVGEDEAA